MDRRMILLGLGALTILFVSTVKYWLFYFTPFFIGLILASIVDPVVDWLEARSVPRGLSASLCVFVVFFVLLVTAAGLVLELSSEIGTLLQGTREILEDASVQMQTLFGVIEDLPPPFADLFSSLATRLDQAGELILKETMRGFSHLPHAAFSLFVALLTGYFLTKDKRKLAKGLQALFSAETTSVLFRVKRELVQGVFGYLRAQLILVAISAVVALMAFHLTTLRYAWLLGLLAGFLDFIPMIGPSGVFVPALFYTLYRGLFVDVAVIGTFWFVVILIRQWWEPLIIAKQLGLHPISCLVSIYLGVQILGIFGFLLGPLFLIAFKAVFMVLWLDRTL